jgi:hypothetical protein
MARGETSLNVGVELASALKIEPVAKPENAPNAEPTAGINIISVSRILLRNIAFWSMFPICLENSRINVSASCSLMGNAAPPE